MYRQFHLCNPETALKLYKTFVRPHLEYASIAWDPLLVKDTQSLERTQKFALRTCFKDWTCSYEELLARAHLPTLAERRKRAKLFHLFKIIHGLTDCQSAPIQVKSPTYDTKQVSNLSLESPRAKPPNFNILSFHILFPYGTLYLPILSLSPHFTLLDNHSLNSYYYHVLSPTSFYHTLVSCSY